jgi:hypothetical protein
MALERFLGGIHSDRYNHYRFIALRRKRCLILRQIPREDWCVQGLIPVAPS